MEEYRFNPIGYVRAKAESLPRHWTISDIEGQIIINPEYNDGLKGIKAGDKIVVIFYFHKSPPFTYDKLNQKPAHINEQRGVFSICSPHRPNPIGLSVLEVVDIFDNVIKVRRIDMLDGTPVLDIKPYIEYKPYEKQAYSPSERSEE